VITRKLKANTSAMKNALEQLTSLTMGRNTGGTLAITRKVREGIPSIHNFEK